jgi:hypothetical protein
MQIVGLKRSINDLRTTDAPVVKSLDGVLLRISSSLAVLLWRSVTYSDERSEYKKAPS